MITLSSNAMPMNYSFKIVNKPNQIIKNMLRKWKSTVTRDHGIYSWTNCHVSRFFHLNDILYNKPLLNPTPRRINWKPPLIRIVYFVPRVNLPYIVVVTCSLSQSILLVKGDNWVGDWPRVSGMVGINCPWTPSQHETKITGLSFARCRSLS